MAVGNCAGQLLLNWSGRREHLAHLVPLLITGLEDESPQNVQKTREMWRNVGEKWLNEECKMDSKVKEMRDFPLEPPKHYPKMESRPSLGCRLIVSRITYKLKTALERDLRDWLAETRLKTSQLTYQIILHLERDLVAHAENFLDIMRIGMADSEKEVVLNVSLILKYLIDLLN